MNLSLVNRNNPLVSVIIPTYKRAKMLPRAIDSVLNQSYKNIEIIVVDDNDPNSNHRKEVEKIMRKYERFSNVKYIKHSENKNGSAARNTGIKVAKGKYVGFLDDDNFYYPNKIEKQVNYLLKNPEYKAVYCGLQRGEKVETSNQVGDLTYEQLTGTNIIDTNMILMERSIALTCGGWDERLRRNQDVSFMLRYFKTGNKVGVVNEVLAYYDYTDRSNVSNPVQYEKDTELFLKLYYDQIKICQQRIKNAEKNIYSYRYRAVLLNYLKHKKFIGAIKVYFKMLIKAPLISNKLLIIGIFHR